MSNVRGKNERIESLWDDMSIEQRASDDLAAFVRKRGKPIRWPVFAEEIASELWDTSLRHSSSLTTPDGEVALARFDPNSNTITLNTGVTGVPGRTAYSIAHEVGHISLHGFLASVRGFGLTWCHEVSVGMNGRVVERQADQYAAALLMPKTVMIEKIEELAGQTRLNLEMHGRKLAEHFGVSRQALEVRLNTMMVPFSGGMYRMKSRMDYHLDEMDMARREWNTNES